MNVYEAYTKKLLDENIQERIEGFASQGKDMAEKMFRAGFIAGILRKEREITFKSNQGEKK